MITLYKKIEEFEEPVDQESLTELTIVRHFVHEDGRFHAEESSFMRVGKDNPYGRFIEGHGGPWGRLSVVHWLKREEAEDSWDHFTWEPQDGWTLVEKAEYDKAKDAYDKAQLKNALEG